MNELHRTKLVAAKKEVTIVENQLRNVHDKFDQSIVLLKQKDRSSISQGISFSRRRGLCSKGRSSYGMPSMLTTRK
jgi:hypothetical protein